MHKSMPKKGPPPQHTQSKDFLFNRTSLLSSALQKLKKTKPSAPKRTAQEPIPLDRAAPNKKVKTTTELPQLLTFTPLQKDYYNFYTVNKITLKNYKTVPEPKLEVGSLVLTAVCDRGIGGKYLVTNLYRNKKAYLDFMDVPMFGSSQQGAIEAIEKYDGPGDFLVGAVIKGRNPGKTQLSLKDVEEVNEGELRTGQVLVGEVESKEEVGCLIRVKGIGKSKVFLSKSDVPEEDYANILEKKHIVVAIKEVQSQRRIVKVGLLTHEDTPLNLRGTEEEEMSKLQLQHYVVPGTLIHTKILKVLTNGVIVKFLKIFVGFIHADHLERSLQSYSHDQKILCRVLFQCASPPLLYLSERHRSIRPYQPQNQLYSPVEKPSQLRQIQGSFLQPESEFYVHPINLHSQINNLNKFWSKENNYLEGYQMMTSRKLGLRVGEIAKTIPFSNFKVFGQGEGKFRVMCLDVWSKVIKVTYQPLLLKAKNLLMAEEDIQEDVKYAGFIANLNQNGVVIEFCNHIRGIISQRQLKVNGIQLTSDNKGEAIEVYATPTKKSYLALSLTPPTLRKSKTSNDQVPKPKEGKEWSEGGIIQSVNPTSIHPIYIKMKNKLIKISIFDGIRPPSPQELPLLQSLADHFNTGDRVQVYHHKGKHYLYPPQQLRDPQLRFCRVVKVQAHSLRVQTNQNEFMNCHISDVTDLISPAPLHEFKVGEYTIGRVVDGQSITLRRSIVEKGVPSSMKQVLGQYKEAEKNGDYRARIDAVGPSALKIDMVAFGYVKSIGDKGLFVSLSRNFDVRIDQSELSDHFIAHRQQVFPPNRIVLCRLIGYKQKSQKGNQVQFDGSLRESVVKYGYPLNDQILEAGVGLTVEGTVTGYAKGKALVRLHSSKFTGIIALKDVEGHCEEETLEKALPIGRQIKCKVIQYSREDGKRLIRLSMTKKYFKTYQGLETTFDSDPRIQALWDSYQQLAAFELPQEEPQQLESLQKGDGLGVNQNAEVERLRKMLGIEEQEEGAQQMQEQQLAESGNDEMQGEELMEERDGQEVEQEMEEEEGSEGDAEQEEDPQQRREMQQRAAQFQPLPHPKQFYQSLVLANPTPESHLLYISSLLPTSSPQEIRAHFERAIRSFESIKDKDNMWISWLNTQIILGGLPETVQKAIQANVGPIVHYRIVQILSEQENWEVAISFARKMLKKFNRELKAYLAFLTLIQKYQEAGHTIPQDLSWKQIMRRANQCLRANQVIQIQQHHAKNLFAMKAEEQGRNLFEQLIMQYPRRCDMWSVYIDQEIKYGNAGKARTLFERVLSVDLKKKAVRSILKKYYHFQEKQGNEQAAERILKRAQTIAMSYQQLQEQEDDEVSD